MHVFLKCLVGGVCTAVVAAAVSAAPVAPLKVSAVDSDHTTMKTERKYKCIKCNQIFTYDRPGNYKCPNCGKNLIPVH